ncbi:hypothetical protein ACL1CN_10370 [Corynebacterium striatum]|nr:hypothetical protein [Corynebacterium striatum]HCG2985198.1 hypothetical protein [Corynebacterium striatum]HCG3001020.1 hypothetical protein [Corynebacterium striatum]HCG3016911.1 hypothetical protein [Corynebacterium striatum]HCG3143542.1 hypothetical protein [Corynebacterium striatum]
MNNNTERLAREWAEKIKAIPRADRRTDVTAAMEYILANTTPPTMADVEWDFDKHYLAGAVDLDGNEVTMVGVRDGLIRVFDVADINRYYAPVLENPNHLTPNRKRYELREISEPEHPETLTTLEDYENAPAGTIVAIHHHSPCMKYKRKKWTNLLGTELSVKELADKSRKVLRWGWGD